MYNTIYKEFAEALVLNSKKNNYIIYVSRNEKYKDTNIIIGFTVKNSKNKTDYFETLLDKNDPNPIESAKQLLNEKIKKFIEV